MNLKMSLSINSSDKILCNRCNATLAAPTPLSNITISQIRTNHIPSSLERNRIFESILEAQKHILRYDEEIARLRSLTADVERGRTELQRYVDAHRGLVHAPVRAVPTELLSEIFMLAKPHYRSDRINSRLGLMPLRVGQVCTRWRNVALSTERLWSDISVGSIRGDKDGRSPALVLVETYLTRSGSRPLSIRIAEMKHTLENDRVFIALARESSRWLRADVQWMDDKYWSSSLLAPSRGSLPLLEDLAIKPNSHATRFFSDSPRLHTLTLAPSNDCSGLKRIPWSQITVLHTADFLRKLLPVLYPPALPTRCPRLLHLVFNADFPP